MQKISQVITLITLVMMKKILLAAIVAVSIASCCSPRRSHDISYELEHGRAVDNYVRDFIAD